MEEPKNLETPAKKRMNWGALLAWVGLFALLGIVAIGMKVKQAPPVAIGKLVPDFTLTMFDGSQVQLKDLRGKVVVINFWASWCKPCEQEAADLEAAWRYYEAGIWCSRHRLTNTEPASRPTWPGLISLIQAGPGIYTSKAFVHRCAETYIIDHEGILAYKFSPSSLNEIRLSSTLLEPNKR
jgi:cytochrome c biogenesis protein CcmG/thiol:disulfide interchange protein DsbE